MNRVGEIVFGSAAVVGTAMAGGVEVEAQQPVTVTEQEFVMDGIMADALDEAVVLTESAYKVGRRVSDICVVYNPETMECNQWVPDPPADTPAPPPEATPPAAPAPTPPVATNPPANTPSQPSPSPDRPQQTNSEGGNPHAGDSGGTYEAPPQKPWNTRLAETYPQQCDDDHPIEAYLDPVVSATEGFDSAEQLNVEADSTTWQFDYYLGLLQSDRIDPETGELLDSVRFVDISDECRGLYEPMSPNYWMDELNWSREDYKDFYAEHGRFPTYLDIVVDVEVDKWNITPIQPQRDRAEDEHRVLQERLLEEAGITEEQFLNGEADLGNLLAK